MRVCDSLSCELAGGRELIEGLQQGLGAGVRVIPAPCVGRCEQAPVAVVGRNPVAHATPARVASLVGANKIECPVEPYVSYDEYRAQGGYKVAAECLSGRRDVEEILKAMESSGLRGLGGAGFPAGRKWRIVRAEPAPRLMAVNIDEGEPGTFKDRYYLERDPHRFLEGILIAAWTVQISEVYIYLRDEYAGCRAILEREIAALHVKSAVRAAADLSAARSRRVYLRRRVGDDRIDRRQARHAPAASAVRCASRIVRASDARAQHGNALLGARHHRERR